jgi:hypothetical protein
MPPLVQRDAKYRLFDLECPELTGSDSSQSPAASSSSSGGYYSAPSPSHDAKDLELGDTAISMYSSPADDLSPVSCFGESYFNAESSCIWPESTTVPSSDFSLQYDSNWWPCSQYPLVQQSLDVSCRPPTVPIQSHHDGMYTPAFQEMFPMSMSHLAADRIQSQQHNMPMDLVDYGSDGLVVPGNFFNNTLDRYAVTDPSPVSFNSQPMPEVSRPVETEDVDFSDDSARSSVHKVPERIQIARNTKDEYLQEARRRGLSYKEIKRRGGFTQAESTLRGRIRILSKPKEMRVRKPHWHRADVSLLVVFFFFYKKLLLCLM